MDPKVSIIILNWNGWKDTIECIESLFQINYSHFNVILVDNGSIDNSLEQIRSYCQGNILIESPFFEYNPNNKPINIIEYSLDEIDKNLNNISTEFKTNLFVIKAQKNYGFAEGNNIGIKFCMKYLETDYILFLNNDTVIDNDFLNKMLLTASDENADIIGSKIYFYDNPTLLETVGAKISWKLGEVKSIGYKKNKIDMDYSKELDAISGCSMLIKKDVFLEIGFLDPHYFLYYEDTDFCLRAKNAGYKIVCSPKAELWHKSSASSKKTSGKREFYSARNLFIFMRKYSNKKNFTIFLMYFLLFRLWFTGAIIILYHREVTAFVPFVKGVFYGITGKD